LAALIYTFQIARNATVMIRHDTTGLKPMADLTTVFAFLHFYISNRAADRFYFIFFKKNLEVGRQPS
jgi:hypothetical protein